jgi:hypothetical protein
MSRTIGRGWATVDLDRAAAEMRHLLPSGGAFEAAERSEALGARCHRAWAGAREVAAGASVATVDEPDADWIVLLEPDTEGRLAAFLARNGEGWAATWTRAADDAATGRPGPLGPESLTPGEATQGPFRLVLTAATIEP